MLFRSLRWTAAAVLAAFVGALEPSVRAADTPPAATTPAKEKRKTVPFTGKLKAVDKSAQTITLAGKTKDRVFHITAQTKITKDGKPATLDEAIAGDEVGGYAVTADDGKSNVMTLRLGPKPETTTKTKKKADSQN